MKRRHASNRPRPPTRWPGEAHPTRFQTSAGFSRKSVAQGIVRDYTRISAPFSGLVTAKSVEPGNLAAPGAPLLTRGAGGRLSAWRHPWMNPGFRS